jgi:hypothetical protein
VKARSRTILLAVLVVLAPALTFAHPGHGDANPENGSRYLPLGIALLAIVAIVAATGWRRARVRRRASRASAHPQARTMHSATP